jgi:hypothetical protein
MAGLRIGENGFAGSFRAAIRKVKTPNEYLSRICISGRDFDPLFEWIFKNG